MTEDPSDEGGETRGAEPAAELPAIIQLPDESQLQLPPLRPQRGRHTGNMKGRHFGPRRVPDPLDAWVPAVRCTKAQREQLEEEAKAARLSMNAYQRQKLFGDPGKRAHRKPGPDAEWFVKMLASLGRSGNNLNQLLRRVNAYDFRDQPELLEMQAAMKAAHAAHCELCEAIMARLGV